MNPDYTLQNVNDDEIDHQYHVFVRAIESSLSTLDTSPVLVKADGSPHLYDLYLDDYYNDLFYERLKIVGGAFSVLEEVSKQALLLFRKDHNRSPDVKDSDFIWFPYEAKYFEHSIAIVIDRLFLTTRESQKINKNAPDFLRFINQKNYSLACLTNKVTEHHSTPVLYCDNSEILIFLLCYFELLERSGIVGTEQPHWPENSPEAVSVLDHDKPASDHLDTVHRTFLKYSQKGKILQSENLYWDLGITDINGKPSSLFNALKQRLERCGCELRLSSVSDLPQAIDLVLVRLFNIRENNYEGSLRKLHLLARFPIIPYLEILLKRNEKIGIGHLVFPVWKSYSFAPEVQVEEEKRKEYNVVFALLTVDDALYGDNAFAAKFNKLSRIIRRLGQITADMVFYKKLAHKRVQQQATRAAISQVLARNMSHNIGSHVSYRATNLQIKRRVRELFSAIGENRNIFSPMFADWLDHFSDRLDKYEIYRNEYLSDFDLSPKSLMFFRDLVLPLCENMFVMDNIAAGEQLNYFDVNTTRLKIKCRIDGEEIKAEYPDLAPMFEDDGSRAPIAYPDNFPYLLKNKMFDNDEPDRHTLEAALSNKRILGAKDVEVCVHSEQALYSILENFIRNSAKHKPRTHPKTSEAAGNQGEKVGFGMASRGSDPELIVYVDLVRENSDEHYSLYLYDSTSKVPPKGLFNNKESETPGIFQKIGQTLLDLQGKPRRANWGYADMKINSFLLWNDINDLDDSQLSENFKLVTINKDASKFTEVTEELISSLTDSEVRFGYKIRLSASRKILWIGDFNSEQESKFKTEGLVRLDSLRDSVHEMKGLASFQFAVLNSHVDYAEFVRIEEKLPGRVILLGADGHDLSLLKKPSVRLASDDDVPKESMQDLLRWCWRQWLADPVDLYIYFENKEVAKTWSEVDLPERLKFTQVDNITRQKSLDGSKINVIYNRHGGVFEGKGGKRAKLCLPTGIEEMNFATMHSIIFFDKGSEDFAQLYYPPTSSDEREMLVYELVDAATTNVFVIDERIADYAVNPRPKEFRTNGVEIGTESLREQNWNMYAAGKLFVVHEFINGQTTCSIGKRRPEDEKLRLQVDAGDLKFSTSIRNLEAIGDDSKVRKDVLIIHRTYLDRAKIGMEPKEFLRLAKQKFGMVFITSGGGYPHSLNLDERCRFISFSTLESCINSRLSKNRLNGILRTNIN